MPPETFRDLMRLVHGFEAAKVLLVANDLDLFRHLEGKTTAAGLAGQLDLDPRATTLLLNALVAMGLLVKAGEEYRNAPVATEFLSGQSYRGHIFRHIHHCWESWNDLAAVLRRGGPDLVRESAILHDEEAWNRDFILGMDDVTRELAPQVVVQLDLDDCRRLLDVGGGPGTYVKAFLEKCPALQDVTIFDLPQALAVARERLSDSPDRELIHLLEGDFLTKGFGEGFDVVWISQVFHSQNEDGCRMLIDKAWRALAPGGRLMVHEFLLDETHAAPLSAALFAVHMLVMTENGRTYSGGEIAGWAEARGFIDTEVRKVSEETGVVIARKPFP